MNVPSWIFVGFEQQGRQDSQTLNNDTFCRLPVTNLECLICSEKHPDAAKLFEIL